VTIDILCKVVDNYGDIGVAYRLAKALADLDPGLSLRLHVDDLAAFASLCPEVDPAAEVQELRGWQLLRWGSPAECRLEPRPRLVLECFACGRPEGLEELLFDPADPEPRSVVNIEHLSAEGWVPGFHLLPAATRSGLVRKTFFMPGFVPGTGGLLIDRAFREAASRWREARAAGPGPLAAARAELAARLGLALAPGAAAASWLPLFCYERDFAGLVARLGAYAGGGSPEPSPGASKLVGRPLLVLAAAGRSQGPFLEAWEAAGRPFPAIALPFLPQEAWDELLLAADFSVVRGEESLARAALAGRPFLWQAYRQEGGYQQVKVRALLELLRPRLGPADFALLEEAWLAFNEERPAPGPGPGSPGAEPPLPALLGRAEALGPAFEAFAAGIGGLGDLAANLVTFIREIV